MNVKINLPAIKDEAFKSETAAEVSLLIEKARNLRDGVHSFVSEKLH